MQSDITPVFVAGVGIDFDQSLDVYPKCEFPLDRSGNLR